MLAIVAHWSTVIPHESDLDAITSHFAARRLPDELQKRFDALLIPDDQVDDTPKPKPVTTAPAYIVDALAAIGLALQTDAGELQVVDQAGAVISDGAAFMSMDDLDEWLAVDAPAAAARNHWQLADISFSEAAAPADVEHVARVVIQLAMCAAADYDAGFVDLDELRLDAEGSVEALDDPGYDELMRRLQQVEQRLQMV